jgi:acyl-CoA synthetase (AMP-forming)/AMP-acid ligase II
VTFPGIASLLARTQGRDPDRVALDHAGQRWTYGEAAAAAARLGAELRERGVAPGASVAWIGENTPACWLAYFGAAWAGAILVPLHLRLTDEDLRRVLAHADVHLLLCDPASLARARGLGFPTRELTDAAFETSAAWRGRVREPEPVASDTPAHLYYTSGSTGTPKGVVLTHGNVVTHAALAVRALALEASDVWLHAAPMFHLADAWATVAITDVGGVHRFVPRFDEAAVLDAFASGVTVTNLVPTMWNALVRHPEARGRDYRSLRLLLSGGAAVSPELVRRIRATFRAEYAQTYGLTETSPYLTISRLEDGERGLGEDEICRRLACAGRPMQGVDVRVVREDGSPVPADGVAVGEVVARGPTVTPGYRRNDSATAAAFRDGWFHTGDLARVHPDGRIDLADRTGDVVNTGGEKVFTTDVERALADLEGVREIAVVGTPDPHWGQVVTAVVVPEGAGVDLARVAAHARARLADFKVPRRLVVLDALPRTASGKVSKRDVRAAAIARLETAP